MQPPPPQIGLSSNMPSVPSMPTLGLPGLSGTVGCTETSELKRGAAGAHQPEAASLRPMPPVVAGFTGFETGSIRRMPVPTGSEVGSLRRVPMKPPPPASNYDSPVALAPSTLRRTPAPPGGRPLPAAGEVGSLRRVAPPPPASQPPPPTSHYDAAPSIN